MVVALWIIAICEIIRAAQNVLQLRMISHDTGARDNAYAEFVKSLKSSDREFVRQLLEEFDKGATEDGEMENERQPDEAVSDMRKRSGTD